jgi:hypothetical protein
MTADCVQCGRLRRFTWNSASRSKKDAIVQHIYILCIVAIRILLLFGLKGRTKAGRRRYFARGQRPASPSPWYHRRLACVPRFPPTATIVSLKGRPCLQCRLQTSGRHSAAQAGRLCYFSLGLSVHARHRVHGIIGVSPVSPIPADGDDRKPERQTLSAVPFADFQPSFRDTGGTPMLLFARPQHHARHRAHGIIGVSPVSRFPPMATIRPEGGSPF